MGERKRPSVLCISTGEISSQIITTDKFTYADRITSYRSPILPDPHHPISAARGPNDAEREMWRVKELHTVTSYKGHVIRDTFL